MNEEDQANFSPNSNPHISQAARVSILSGILSVISVFLALWGAFLVMRAGIYTFLPTGREYLYPLFWLLWLPLPILTIICGSYARKTATEQGGHHFALISLVLGYLSLAIIGAYWAQFIAPVGIVSPGGRNELRPYEFVFSFTLKDVEPIFHTLVCQ